MNIIQLNDATGQLNNYQVFKVNPSEGDTIRVIKTPVDEDGNWNDIYKDISLDKVYSVMKVENVKHIIVIDDSNTRVHLSPRRYDVVEKVSEKEINLLKERNELIQIIDKKLNSNSK